jgi:uncharacterized protein
VDIIVKKSGIEGKGVFATRDFKKGETVIEWDISHQLPLEKVKRLPENKKEYVIYTKGKIILQQLPAKYVNHSCNPNTRVKNFCDVAMRNIKKGEEITSDYTNDLNSDEIMNCNCGSKNCKRIITSKKFPNKI